MQERTAEILKQKKEIENQRDQIAAQKKDITDSIVYASRIQQAVLPTEKFWPNRCPNILSFSNHAILSAEIFTDYPKRKANLYRSSRLYRPWGSGAFMSMLGMSFLNEIVLKVMSMNRRKFSMNCESM